MQVLLERITKVVITSLRMNELDTLLERGFHNTGGGGDDSQPPTSPEALLEWKMT